MGKNWAIAIGINNYDNLQPLKYAQRDAEVMAAWFREEARFDQVFLFTENSPPIPANPPIPTQPTAARFRRFLNAQFETPLLNPEDNLWFFFAGHGKRYNDQDYLMFPDSDPGDSTTAISVDFITQRLRRCGADNVVLLLDACRDEGSRGGLGIGEEEHQGVITFYSCAANQQSWEIDELQHGAFTYSLLEGLRLQGEGNCATVERLDQYLSYHVPHLNQRYSKPLQKPYLKAEPPGKIYYILLNKVATIKDVEPLKYQASQAENKGDLLLAKQLWKRILALPGVDEDAVAAIERIAQKESSTNQSSITRRQFLEWAGWGSGSLMTALIAIKFFNQTSSNASSITPSQKQIKIPSQTPITLSKYNFETVRVVDKAGTIGNPEKKESKFFKEDLGNNISLDMVYIPAGSFMMGTEDAEIERLVKKSSWLNWYGFGREKPQHQVNVPAFCMGKYPVTQAQWRAVAALTQINRKLEAEPSRFKGDDLPVERVSWHDAVEFCARLSKETGKEYRLPSEAEWEYACRAGTTTPFHFGETITSKLANYRASNTFAQEVKGEYREKTTPVGQFPANAFGLCDMHGNVLEWCLDDWHDNYQGAPKDGSPWFDGKNNNLSQKNGFAVLRGGSWFSNPEGCRSACRYNVDGRDNFNDSFGFRVVCGVGRSLL